VKTLFEKIYDGEIPADVLHKDDLCCAFHDNSPQAPTHVLIVPRKPIARIAAASESDQPMLGHLLSIAAKLAVSLGIDSSGYRIVINNGSHGGETVPHLHVHLLGGRQLEWPPG
jgi:histidine triad (HIT) family protein